MLPRASAALAAIAAAAALATGGGARAGATPARLSVAAAANLKVVMEALRRGFEAERPGVEIAVTTGASGAFVAQIRQGAPFDVLFSADRDYPRALVQAGLGGPGGEVVYAIGRLALWVPPGSPLEIERRGLAALADPAARRIAIANPAVAPYGRAARAALAAAGVEAAVKDRLVLGENVSQAAQFAQSGAADAALIPLSLTLAPPLREGRTWIVPDALHPPLEQSALVLGRARNPALAEAFLRFVTGPAGREILARHGYTPP